MKSKLNILIFPCGSEIALEIYRSLKYSTHVNLIGANSVSDHGRFVFERYIDNVPFVNSPDFVPALAKIVKENTIDAIYPAMDSVITILTKHEEMLGCKVIASSRETTEICLSKTKTYAALKDYAPIAKIYDAIDQVSKFPIFMKPDIGYGSRGARIVHNVEEAILHLKQYPTSIIMDYLPGPEYTVDCFSDRHGELRFVGPRVRSRTMNGISVHTYPYKERRSEFQAIASSINQRLNPRGAWFFQIKEDHLGNFFLLEVASRLGGSSSLYRNLGINFALLSVFDTFNYDVEVFSNTYDIEMDRALDNKYRTSIDFSVAYFDFDDCLLLGNKVNADMVKLIFQFRNAGKRIVLITKHEKDINETLSIYRLADLFDRIIHLTKEDDKYKYIDTNDAIFIDDSHAERRSVYKYLGIPVFSPDTIECLFE
ncbi:ATP-grasp domain-containing protein [Parapedobacter composti]|uniref:ATP-grasp domain-containing protein n=1 Tax=Parapedobacter composti TaxID=623281 RepID=A0A1I1IWU5_9SPHI|nr:ATP-grasp domain-containing protein [Parapedobacter composti]SFC38808.1 ATP-grasp domain-containing protein [Parapedobacter composti]